MPITSAVASRKQHYLPSGDQPSTDSLNGLASSRRTQDDKVSQVASTRSMSANGAGRYTSEPPKSSSKPSSQKTADS
jgi:hypothetical protein